MKQRKLVMIRHAKSSWANPLQSDFERPLNDRGEHDAPMMGKRLKERKIIPDLIISSTAKRAKQTAKKIAAEVDYDTNKIVWYDKLYHCIPSVFEEVIYEINDNLETVFIVGHNPGITEFSNQQTPNFSTSNMPTCSMVGIEFESKQWNEFINASKKIFLFDYPKKET